MSQVRFTNAEIARLLRQIAAVYEATGGDFFKVRAYQNAAESVDHTATSLHDLWQEKRLNDVPGLGEKLIVYLDELFRTGTVKHFLQIKEKLPAGFFPLLDVPGFGPKKAAKLAELLSLRNEKTALSDLQKALESGKLQDTPGFAQKSLDQLKESLALMTAGGVDHHVKTRLLLIEAEVIAERIIRYLRLSPDVLEVEVLGSLRRRNSLVGDIDLAVKTNTPSAVHKHITDYSGIFKLISSGESTTMFVESSGVQIDIKTQDPARWGSMLQHYTGSKIHNIQLRELALQKGMSLSEHGILSKGERQEFTSESDFYQSLGMQWIPPEIREGRREIELALAHSLPSLIEESDIKGDLHIHTDLPWPTSHDIGRSSVSEYIQAALKRGYEYIGFSDHNPKSGISEQEMISLVRERKDAIAEAAQPYEKNIHVLHGLEIDIKPDGSLAVPDAVLKELDYALVSIHSAFTQSVEVTTDRVLRALSHPKVRIWAHPSGRKLNKREGVDCDWRRVFSFCAERGIFVEVNGTPDRLDLSESLMQVAVETGAKLIVNTDSHQKEHLNYMRFGIFNARRGWVQAQYVVNTLPWKKFSAYVVQ